MSQINIELQDGPRGGDSIRINNVWEYPEHVVVPYKGADGTMHMVRYVRERIQASFYSKSSARYVYKHSPEEA